jgi:hypothetical protein
VSLWREEQKTQNLAREALRRRSRDAAKEKMLMLFDRLVLFAQNMIRYRANEDQDGVDSHFAWPRVMNSLATMQGRIAWGTWIWHHQHSRGHHGYYRTHR